MSHNLTVRSMLPEARRRPSGLQATAVTARRCPRRVKAGLALGVIHPWTLLSVVAAARIRPSGPTKATLATPVWSGVSVLKNSRAVAVSHARTHPSGLPAATHRPSALNATLAHGTVRSLGP